MGPRRRDCQGRPGFEGGGRGFQLGQNERSQEESRDDIDCDHGLVVLSRFIMNARYAGVSEEDIDAVQLGVHAGSKFLHASVAGHIELPDFNGILCAMSGRFDVPLRGLAFFQAANGEDQPAGAKTGVVSRGFFTEAGVAASNDDGFPCVGGRWHGQAL